MNFDFPKTLKVACLIIMSLCLVWFISKYNEQKIINELLIERTESVQIELDSLLQVQALSLESFNKKIKEIKTNTIESISKFNTCLRRITSNAKQLGSMAEVQLLCEITALFPSDKFKGKSDVFLPCLFADETQQSMRECYEYEQEITKRIAIELEIQNN